MERRLAAILAADVVGYSSLMGADEKRALSIIRRLREELFEPIVSNWRGLVVKRLGDGWLVEFPSVVDAVNCAVSVQSQLIDVSDIELRIGVHIGDIVHEEGDIYGDGVNIAARLEASSIPGHVLVSDDVYRQISGLVDATFHDVGPLELKNITEPVHAWSWPNAIEEISNAFQEEKKPGVYVSEFEARGDDATDFAETVCEDLVTAFARQTGVSLVTEPNSADYKISGSIRGSNDRWRISVNLTDQTNDKVVWSERFEESGSDVFEIQDRCVMRIAGAVRIRMPSLLSEKLEERALESLGVEELLNYAMNKHFSPTSESWSDAVPALELALQQDAENWMAMTMLCFNTLAKSRIFGWRPMEQSDLEKARALIEQAQSIKPNNEVVRMAQGALLLYAMQDHRAARIEAEEALKLNPEFYHSINLMSQVELFTGNIRKAIELVLRSVDCDPAYPYLHLYQRGAGYVHAVSGRYTEAIDSFERANRAAPGLPQNLIGLAVSLHLSGEDDTAQEVTKTLLNIAPDFNLAEVAAWPFSETTDWKPYEAALAESGAPLQPPLRVIEGGAV